jgi:hypothetical protein
MDGFTRVKARFTLMASIMLMGAAGAFFLSVLKSRRCLSKCAELQRELEATKRKMEYYQINLARVDQLKNRELNALKAELAKLKA